MVELVRAGLCTTAKYFAQRAFVASYFVCDRDVDSYSRDLSRIPKPPTKTAKNTASSKKSIVICNATMTSAPKG
jgi:hypothetical protein